MVRWLNTPCTDPAGRVFAADGRVFRAVFPGKERAVLSVLENPEVRALMDDGLVARMWVADRKVDGYGLILEAERAPFDIPCERYTRETLRAATLHWLDTCRRLAPSGLALSDAHFGNYMLFGANVPRWVDLGSIRPESAVEKERPFRSFRRFWSGMLAPLTLLALEPRHARLARLAIADHPYQGPLTVAGEPPLNVDEPAADALKRVRSDVDTLGAEQALARLGAFIAQLPRSGEADGAGAAEAGAAVLDALGQQCGANRIASVICLGADAFLRVSRSWGKADALVIDENEASLDRLGQALKERSGGGQVALYFGHPVNRVFLKNPPVADAVIAVDPLARYAHHSHVEAENLAHILGTLGRRIAVVITGIGGRARAEQMLGHEFPSVTTLASSWLGFGPAVVVGRK